MCAFLANLNHAFPRAQRTPRSMIGGSSEIRGGSAGRTTGGSAKSLGTPRPGGPAGLEALLRRCRKPVRMRRRHAANLPTRISGRGTARRGWSPVPAVPRPSSAADTPPPAERRPRESESGVALGSGPFGGVSARRRAASIGRDDCTHGYANTASFGRRPGVGAWGPFGGRIGMTRRERRAARRGGGPARSESWATPGSAASRRGAARPASAAGPSLRPTLSRDRRRVARRCGLGSARSAQASVLSR